MNTSTYLELLPSTCWYTMVDWGEHVCSLLAVHWVFIVCLAAEVVCCCFCIMNGIGEEYHNQNERYIYLNQSSGCHHVYWTSNKDNITCIFGSKRLHIEMSSWTVCLSTKLWFLSACCVRVCVYTRFVFQVGDAYYYQVCTSDDPCRSWKLVNWNFNIMWNRYYCRMLSDFEESYKHSLFQSVYTARPSEKSKAEYSS